VKNANPAKVVFNTKLLNIPSSIRRSGSPISKKRRQIKNDAYSTDTLFRFLIKTNINLLRIIVNKRYINTCIILCLFMQI